MNYKQYKEFMKRITGMTEEKDEDVLRMMSQGIPVGAPIYGTITSAAPSNPFEDLVIGPQKKDKEVENPYHYNHKGIECIAAIEASMEPLEFQAYLKGNTLKYLWRYQYKGKALQDVEKAQWYINLLVEKVKEYGEKNAD